MEKKINSVIINWESLWYYRDFMSKEETNTSGFHEGLKK